MILSGGKANGLFAVNARTLGLRASAIQRMTGTYLNPLHEFALSVAVTIGRIESVLARNSFNTKMAEEYLREYAANGSVGVAT